MKDSIEIAIPIAASVAERAASFVADGWVQGLLASGYKGAQNYCANGAISLALEEIFGKCDVNHINGLSRSRCTSEEQLGAKTVYDLLVTFAKQEAEIRFGHIPSALENNISHFNDKGTTSQEDVIAVLKGAAERLWALLPETESERSWADEPEEEIERQYVTA